MTRDGAAALRRLGRGVSDEFQTETPLYPLSSAYLCSIYAPTRHYPYSYSLVQLAKYRNAQTRARVNARGAHGPTN
eukprot:scaffold2217_cov132-Isochrysis_galbana.AAC.4